MSGALIILSVHMVQSRWDGTLSSLLGKEVNSLVVPASPFNVS